jgi:mevalonate kinase
MPVDIDTVHDGLDSLHIHSSANGSKRSHRSFLDRKASSPMMPAFMVSAPGKVIVFGEHAVVHGKVCRVHRMRIQMSCC